MMRFKMDLKAAVIPFLNASGQRADFHSLRHSLATNLARAGTAPRVAMEIMRVYYAFWEGTTNRDLFSQR